MSASRLCFEGCVVLVECFWVRVDSLMPLTKSEDDLVSEGRFGLFRHTYALRLMTIRHTSPSKKASMTSILILYLAKSDSIRVFRLSRNPVSPGYGKHDLQVEPVREL